MAFDQCSILHNNLTPAATLSGGSWLSDLPLANLKTTELAAKARSTSASTTHTKILIAEPSALTVRAFWWPAHNFTASAQARVLAGTTSGASNLYAGTMADVCHVPATIFDGEVHGVFIILPTAVTAQYFTVEFDDSANPAGYIELGQMLHGDVLTFTRGPSVGLQHGLRDLSTVAEAESGAPWVTERRKQRAVSMVLDVIEDDETDALQDIRQTIGTHGQTVYLPSLTSAAQTQRYGFVGRMAELSPIDYPYSRYRTLPIRLTEWL